MSETTYRQWYQSYMAAVKANAVQRFLRGDRRANAVVSDEEREQLLESTRQDAEILEQDRILRKLEQDQREAVDLLSRHLAARREAKGFLDVRKTLNKMPRSPGF